MSSYRDDDDDASVGSPNASPSSPGARRVPFDHPSSPDVSEREERAFAERPHTHRADKEGGGGGDKNKSDGDVPAWILAALQRPLPVPPPPPPPPPPRGETLSDRVVYLSNNYCTAAAEEFFHASLLLEEEYCAAFEDIEAEEEGERMSVLQTVAGSLRARSLFGQPTEEPDEENRDASGPAFVVDKLADEDEERRGDGDFDKRSIAQQAYRRVITAEEQARMLAFQQSRTVQAAAAPLDSAPREYTVAASQRSRLIENQLWDGFALSPTRSREQQQSQHSLLSARELADLKRNRRMWRDPRNDERTAFLYRDKLTRPAAESGVPPVPARHLAGVVSSAPLDAKQHPIVSPEFSPVFFAARRVAERETLKREMNHAQEMAKKVQSLIADMQRRAGVEHAIETALASPDIAAIRQRESTQYGAVAALESGSTLTASSPPPLSAIRSSPRPPFTKPFVAPDAGYVVDDRTRPVMPLPSVLLEQQQRR